MKKIGILIGVFVAALLTVTGLNVPEVSAAGSAAPTYDTTGWPRFYANGTPITISQNTNGQTIIEWTEHGGLSNPAGSCNSPCVVSNSTEVYGGYLDNNTSTTTSITMNSGTIDTIIGGGRSASNPVVKSHVTNATITINGGTITWGLAAGGVMGTTANNASSLVDSGDPTKAINIVEKAVVTIGTNVNPNSSVVAGGVPNIYGGGMSGLCHVGTTEINVAGGYWNGITAGGSNGHVGDATVNVTGGTFNNIHGNNNGNLNSFTLNMSDGKINSGINPANGALNGLYAGADCGPAGSGSVLVCNSVAGSVGSATLNVTGGTIENVYIGYDSNGDISDNPVKQSEIALNIVSSAITGAINGFAENAATGFFITIDGKQYLADANKALNSNSGWYEDVTTRAGANFLGFKNSDGEDFAVDTIIEASVTLTTSWGQITSVSNEDQVTNPATGDTILFAAGAGLLGLMTLGAGLVLNRKNS